MKELGERLRILRESVKLSQVKMAELLGVKQSSINRYEQGQSAPSLETLVKYADYFDVSMDYLFARTDNPQGKLYEYRPKIAAGSDEMKQFIDETGVDCLAVAVGTSHGVYVHTPKLHFDRLDELNRISSIPMVMHGGSGTPDDQIKEAIQRGICKLNIYSEILSAYYGELKKKLEESGTLAIWVSKANEKSLAALKQVVLEKIDLVGSANKA